MLKRNDTVGEGLNLQRWRVVRKIGEGQFAEVFEVSSTRRLFRLVAAVIRQVTSVLADAQGSVTLTAVQSRWSVSAATTLVSDRRVD